MFTKAELTRELDSFLSGFTESMQRVYGFGVADALEPFIPSATLRRTVLEHYDYGVAGVPIEGLTPDVAGTDRLGDFEDMSLFLQGMDGLEPYLSECDVEYPKLAQKTVRICAARLHLDGGIRMLYDGDEEMSDFLTFAEVALLADMDEKSVRNAAYASDASRLITAKSGKNVRVSLEEARKWLLGRKGFVPTSTTLAQAPSEPPIHIAVKPSTYERLVAAAAAADISVEAFLDRSLG